MKNQKRVSQGRKNRIAGRNFELKVRKDLEKEGWIVCKWSNNVEFDLEHYRNPKPQFKGKLIPAKHKFNPFNKIMTMGTGFPDFIAYKKRLRMDWERDTGNNFDFDIVGVEAKTNGYLTTEEKFKCRWLIDNEVFNRIVIAKKGEKRDVIIYEEIN
jgi:Fe-S cluster assembly scaffold protein SufB